MQSAVFLRSLSVATPDGTLLIDSLTLAFASQRYGLVGRNGCGKSTLLRVLAGEAMPAAGSVSRSGSVGWLRQETGPPEGSVACALGIAERLASIERLLRGEGTAEDAALADWTLEEMLGGALGKVGLAGTDPRRPLGTLSGGQRTRLAVARVLLEAPDILLLDEPTNNLDTEGRALVAGLLRDWRGCVIAASHDRGLLDGVDAIVEVANGTARLFGGAWPDFAADRAERRLAAQAEVDRAMRETRRTALAAQAQRERQARRDSRGRADRARGDAPKTLFDARQDRSERTTGLGRRIADRKASEVSASLAAARAAVEVLAPLRIGLPEVTRTGGGAVLSFGQAAVDHAGRRLLGPLDLNLPADGRLAVVGPNGAGKSTLLRLAAGTLSPSSGSVRRAPDGVALLDQHIAFLQEEERLVDAMHRMNPALSLNESRSALARFGFRNDAAERRCAALSGGERMRAGLASVLSAAKAPAVLLLDEPTNHMDLDSVEVLEAALRGYCGALVVASHDAAFLDAIGITQELLLGT